jgi:hypothetical protein
VHLERAEFTAPVLASEGTKEQIFDLTKAAAAIRKAGPDARIAGGAFNTPASEEWVRGIFTSGAMEHADLIAYNPYMLGPGPAANKDHMPETVMQTIVLLAAEGAGRIFRYELFDHGGDGSPDDAEHWFGLVNGTMKNGKLTGRETIT